VAKPVKVERPTKRVEFEIVFATAQARKGWVDLVATTRSGLADAWDALTRHPTDPSMTCHQLKGSLATLMHAGVVRDRWQYELPGGARLWYYVSGDGKSAGMVHLVEVHTHHPNATK